MSVPEPVTIFAITAGIIEFFNTVRAGIQRIHDDYHSWKHFKLDIRSFRTDWECQEFCVVAWREKWMVWTEDVEFYRYLWGDGSNLIQTLLKEIHNISLRVETSMKPLFGPKWTA